MGGLGEQASVRKFQAELPGYRTVGGNIHFNGVEQTAPPHLPDASMAQLQFLKASTEQLAHFKCILCELFFFQDVEGGNSHPASEGIAAKCRTMLSRSDAQHDFVVSQDGGYGQDSTG